MNLFFVPTAHAAITNPAVPRFGTASPAEALGSLIGTVVGAAIVIAAIGSLLFIVVGGFQWVTGGADKQSLENARNRIVNGIVGLVIVVAAWAIVSLISSFLGLGFPTFTFPTLLEDSAVTEPAPGGGTGAGGPPTRTSRNTFECLWTRLGCTANFDPNVSTCDATQLRTQMETYCGQFTNASECSSAKNISCSNIP